VFQIIAHNKRDKLAVAILMAFKLSLVEKCSKTVTARAPGAGDLRKIVRGFLGGWADFVDGPRPQFWPRSMDFPPMVDGKNITSYNRLKTPVLLDIITAYARYVKIHIDSLDLFLDLIKGVAPPIPIVNCCDAHNHAKAFDLWVNELLEQEAGCEIQSNSQLEASCLQDVSDVSEVRDLPEVSADTGGNTAASLQGSLATISNDEDKEDVVVPKRRRTQMDRRCAPLASPFNTHSLWTTCDRNTSYYPTQSTQYAILRAIFGRLFHGLRFGDFCCGRNASNVYSQLAKFGAKRVVLWDKSPAIGYRKGDILGEDLANTDVDIVITSLPYGRGVCTPLFARLLSHVRINCLKLLNSYERPAISDQRENLLKFVALKILLPPTTYPGHAKALGEIEAWYVCGRSERDRKDILATASAFEQTCIDGQVVFEDIQYKVSCMIGRGLIIFDTRV